jgi:predicted RNA-binding Zn-ribbon protein involved in translation (DUF1610 family)
VRTRPALNCRLENVVVDKCPLHQPPFNRKGHACQKLSRNRFLSAPIRLYAVNRRGDPFLQLAGNGSEGISAPKAGDLGQREGLKSSARPTNVFKQSCLDPGLFRIAQTASPVTVDNAGMLSGELIEAQALKVPCPTCGAGRGMRCERAVGGVRTQSHLDRRLMVSDKVVRRLKPKSL